MPNRIPRLSLEELAPSVRAVLDARVTRLGYLGEFFRCTAHQPDILTPFMEMTEALKRALPDRLTEVGALTIATLTNNAYERNQHERLSEKLGFGTDWISEIERLDPDRANGISDSERAVQRLVLALVVRTGRDVRAELGSVIDQIGTHQSIAILFLVGRYMTHAIIVNALGLQPPVPSIFDRPGVVS